MKTMTERALHAPMSTRRATTLATALAAALAAGLCAAQPAAAPPADTASATRTASPGPTQAQAGARAQEQAPSPARVDARSAVTRASPGADDARSLIARLQALYPATRFGAVHTTAWPGVFEVVMGTNLAYVDASGRYFLFGHLFDMRVQRDLTAERKDALARVDFGLLPLADALTEVRGTGARTLAIFSDPDCPYCRRLEAELRSLDDVTIHTFLMPLASLHPAARGKAVSVWCAPDRLATWRGLMLDDTPPPVADCPHPVDRNVALGERLGINGTPTLVAADGRVLAGAASREQIETWLSRSDPGPDVGADRDEAEASDEGEPQ